MDQQVTTVGSGPKTRAGLKKRKATMKEKREDGLEVFLEYSQTCGDPAGKGRRD